MSYDPKKDTITVNDVTYDVDDHPIDYGYQYTLMLDGEDVFDGIVGTVETDQYDNGHSNPREWSNVGTMAVSYRGYDLGDEDIERIDFKVECPVCEGSNEHPSGDWVVGIHYSAERLAVGSQEDCQEFIDNLPDVESGRYYIEPFGCPKCEGEGEVDIHPVDYFKKEHGARVVIGLTVYEHSGITMRAGNVTLPWDTDRWDTSFVGFIYDTPEGVEQCIGKDATDEQIEAALRSEVEVYASYLEGDVTCWSVEDDETDFHDACGGYVGDHEHCKSEMFAQLEQAIIKRLGENDERAHWNARGTETK